MSLTATITALLQADTTLMTTLTGGVHDAVEISPQLTPTAFDTTTREIKPCALVKTGNEIDGGAKVKAVQTPLTIYFYQRSGFGSIDTALARVHSLLDEKHIGTSLVWNIRFNSEIARTTDEALYCSLAVQRYNVTRKKS
jgi:hypothetical protein